MITTEENVTAKRRDGAISTILSAAVAVTALGLFASVATRAARAGLVVQALDSSADPGGTGAFDVIISDTGGTFQVAGFSVELSVPSAAGVSFTDVTTGTLAASYLFGTLQLAPFTFDNFPNQNFSAGDLNLTPPGFITLNPGDKFGLAHVTYSIAAGTPGSRVTSSLVTDGTSLSDSDGNPISFTTLDGTITVAGSLVPEPSSLVLISLGMALLLIARRGARGLLGPEAR